MNNKYAFATVKRVSNEYTIEEIGTGGTCNTDTSDWKTYTNTQYGFSFDYPSNYNLSELTEFSYQNPNNIRVLSVIIKNPNPRPGGGYPQPKVEAVVFKNDTSSLSSWVDKYTTTKAATDPLAYAPDSIFLYSGLTDKKETTLDGKSATTFQSVLVESSPNLTLTVSGNYIMGIVFDNENESKDPELKNLYPKILSSFKFVK